MNSVNHIEDLLKENPQVSDYKINESKKESFELFYVKGKLETTRATDTCDLQVTVYADHDGFRGDSQFYVYPSTDDGELREKIQTAVCNARMIQNKPYRLPEGETAEETLESNLRSLPLPVLADQIGRQCFASNSLEGGSINSLEVFLNCHRDQVLNSRGLHKTQHYCTAMVEAIPTFSGDRESVELYEQYNFSALDPAALQQEISSKMEAVKARYQAQKPDFSMDCPVVLHRQELSELFSAIASDLNYRTVYNHGNRFQKGDRLQAGSSGDPITITMKGRMEGNVCSSCFDGDGLTLGEITLVFKGTVENYYGSNRFGQYLGEAPTGNLGCLCAEPGTFQPSQNQVYLEVLSMSGLQVDFFNDYIGGEIRLACYHNGDQVLPVTGISISGKVSQVLNDIRLSRNLGNQDGYTGPDTAQLSHMSIF